MLDPDGSEFRHLSVGFDRKSLLELQYRGKADRITGATDCEIVSPSSYFEIGCSWNFESDEDAAKAKLENLRLDMSRCLPEMLSAKQNLFANDNLVVDAEYEVSIDSGDHETVDISLALHRYIYQLPASYKVHLTFSR